MSSMKEITKQEALKLINDLSDNHGFTRSKSIKYMSGAVSLVTTSVKMILWTIIYFLLSIGFTSVSWTGVVLFGFVVSYMRVKYLHTDLKINKELNE